MIRLQKLLAQPSDIYLHLGTLHGLASVAEVGSIVEIGFRKGHSATAFCATGKPVTSIDIERCEPHVTQMRKAYPQFSFVRGDSLEVGPRGCDLLFIDGQHTYRQVLAELELYGPHVRRYIALHDTVTFASIGKDGSKPGLVSAIDEFLAKNTDWNAVLDLPHNNGLMILERG